MTTEREGNRIANRALRAACGPVKYITRANQYLTIALFVKTDRRFRGVHSQVLQNIAVRVDEGAKRWLEALSSGRKRIAPPGFIERKDYKASPIPGMIRL